jgi:heat shock protein HslJ
VTGIHELLRDAVGSAEPAFTAIDVSRRVRDRERRRRAMTATAAVAVLSLAGTGAYLGLRSEPREVAVVTRPEPPSLTSADLVRVWQLDGVSALPPTPGLPSPAGTVEFRADGVFVVVISGCRSYDGRWKLDGGDLTVALNPHASEGCPGALVILQSALLSRLAEPLTVLPTVDDLTTIALKAASGIVVLRLPGAPLPQPGNRVTATTTLPPPRSP